MQPVPGNTEGKHTLFRVGFREPIRAVDIGEQAV